MQHPMRKVEPAVRHTVASASTERFQPEQWVVWQLTTYVPYFNQYQASPRWCPDARSSSRLASFRRGSALVAPHVTCHEM